MCNQCDMFFSLYREYEFKILRIFVKLAYPRIYFIEKQEGWTVLKVPNISKIAVDLVGSTDSSLQRLILLIFHNVFFLKLYSKDKWDFGAFIRMFF